MIHVLVEKEVERHADDGLEGSTCDAIILPLSLLIRFSVESDRTESALRKDCDRVSGEIERER
jgi:hypothetical protein